MIKRSLALIGLCFSLCVDAATIEVWRIDRNAQTATNIGAGFLASDYDYDYGNWHLRSDGVVFANGVQFNTAISGNVYGMDSLNSNIANVYTDLGVWRIDRSNQSVSNIGPAYLASDYDSDFGAWHLRNDGVLQVNGIQYATGITGGVIGLDSLNPYVANVYTQSGVLRIDRNIPSITNLGPAYLASDYDPDFGNWHLRADGVVFANGIQFATGITGNVIGMDSLNPYIANVYVSTVPVPAAAWLFGSALVGLAGVKRRK